VLGRFKVFVHQIDKVIGVGQEEITAVVFVAVGNGEKTVASGPSILKPLAMKRIIEEEGKLLPSALGMRRTSRMYG
jgi:hypothetical protein